MLAMGDGIVTKETKAEGLQNVYTYECDDETWGEPIQDWSWEYRKISDDCFYEMTFVEQVPANNPKNRYVAESWDTHPYASSYDNGFRMHPGDEVDVVKTFTVPRNGRVKLDTSLGKDYTGGDGDTFCIYLNDKKVYPLGGNPIVITETNDISRSCTIDVTDGDKIRYVIGKNNNKDRDSLHMTNIITYVSEQRTEPVVISDQYNNKIVAFDLKGIDNSIKSFKNGNILNYNSAYSPVDVKLRYHKKLRRAFIIGTFGSSIKIINPDNWSVFSSISIPSSYGIHGVEMLPNGTIVAAYDKGNRVTFIETDNSMKRKNEYSYGLPCAHAVLYDPIKKVTRAIGGGSEVGLMREYTYNESTYKPSSSRLYQFNMNVGNANGSNTSHWMNAHYLIQNPYDSNELLISVHAGIITFDKNNNKFSGYTDDEQPKTFSNNRSDGIKGMVMSDNSIYYTYPEDYYTYNNSSHPLHYYSWTTKNLNQWQTFKVGSTIVHTERTITSWQSKFNQYMRVYRIMPFTLQ